MRRGSAIAAVVGAAGILVAGSAAAIALISAPNRSPEPTTVAVVVDPDAITPATAQTAAPVQTPTIAAAELPAVSVPSAAAAPSTSASAAARGAATPATTPTPRATKTREAEPQHGSNDAAGYADDEHEGDDD